MRSRHARFLDRSNINATKQILLLGMPAKRKMSHPTTAVVVPAATFSADIPVVMSPGGPAVAVVVPASAASYAADPVELPQSFQNGRNLAPIKKGELVVSPTKKNNRDARFTLPQLLKLINMPHADPEADYASSGAQAKVMAHLLELGNLHASNMDETVFRAQATKALWADICKFKKTVSKQGVCNCAPMLNYAKLCYITIAKL